MGRDFSELLAALLERIKSRDFSLGFFVDALGVALWILTWLDSANDPPVVQGGPEVALLIELHEELLGEVPATGILDSLLMKMILQALIGKLLAMLEQSDLPAAVIELIRQWLESLNRKA